jgi:hypothetical protein
VTKWSILLASEFMMTHGVSGSKVEKDNVFHLGRYGMYLYFLCCNRQCVYGLMNKLEGQTMKTHCLNDCQELNRICFLRASEWICQSNQPATEASIAVIQSSYSTHLTYQSFCSLHLCPTYT